MEIIKIQEKELNQAREIQKQCVDLHLPTPPVVSWVATMIDEKGNETQQTIAKANSYVRNALNYLTRAIGMSASIHTNNVNFADGTINLRQSNDSIVTTFSSSNSYTLGLGDIVSPIPEDINYTGPIIMEGKWNYGATDTFSDFDYITRKFITQHTVTYLNTSPGPQAITEAGLYIGNGNAHVKTTLILMIRDIFSPINVPSGGSIRFTYQTEVLFPL